MSLFLTLVGVLLLVVLIVVLAIVLGMRMKTPWVLNTIRRMNRSFTNPRQMKSAGTPGAYAAVIRHRGRTSGRPYETPVGAEPTDDGFAIALPYGTQTDWVKNVLASGSATIVNEGQTYRVDRPEIIPLADAADAFPAKELQKMRVTRVEQCLRVRRIE